MIHKPMSPTLELVFDIQSTVHLDILL